MSQSFGQRLGVVGKDKASTYEGLHESVVSYPLVALRHHHNLAPQQLPGVVRMRMVASALHVSASQPHKHTQSPRLLLSAGIAVNGCAVQRQQNRIHAVAKVVKVGPGTVVELPCVKVCHVNRTLRDIQRSRKIRFSTHSKNLTTNGVHQIGPNGVGKVQNGGGRGAPSLSCGFV